MGARPRRSFSREFKLQVVRQLASGEKRFAQLCREHDLCQTLLRRWKEQDESHGENAWPEEMPVQVEADPQVRIAALEAALGRAHLEIEFLRKALALLEKRGSPSERNGR
jgi:transposase